jgi:hypothetical protein
MKEKEKKDICEKALGKSLYNELKESKELTGKEILFIAEYLTNNLQQTKAYLKVYCNNDKSKYGLSGVESHKLLKKPKIKSAIAKVLDEWLGSKKLKLEYEIINRLYKRAFYDPFLFINPDGSPTFKKKEDIPEKWRCCIEGIETKAYGKDATTKITTIRLVDQDKALDKLAKYITLFKENIEVTHTMTDETENLLKKVYDEGMESIRKREEIN